MKWYHFVSVVGFLIKVPKIDLKFFGSKKISQNLRFCSTYLNLKIEKNDVDGKVEFER